MSFKDHDKKNFIADVARDFAARRISKRDFMKKMALAGVGFSAFSAGLLGGQRGFRGNLGLIGTEAMAQDASVTQWLKDVGSPFKGTKIRYTSEATPPTVVLDKIKKEFTDPTGIEVEVEIVPLEQVLAKATQDVQGQLGTYDLYYLDQSWVATFAQDTIAAEGYDLVRRPTGGRAILHTDELTYSVAAPEAEPRVAGGVMDSYLRLSSA